MVHKGKDRILRIPLCMQSEIDAMTRKANAPPPRDPSTVHCWTQVCWRFCLSKPLLGTSDSLSYIIPILGIQLQDPCKIRVNKPAPTRFHSLTCGQLWNWVWDTERRGFTVTPAGVQLVGDKSAANGKKEAADESFVIA